MVITVIATVLGFLVLREHRYKEMVAKVDKLDSLCIAVCEHCGPELSFAELPMFPEAGDRHNNSLYGKEPLSFINWISGDFSSLEVVGLFLSVAPNSTEESLYTVFEALHDYPNLRDIDLSGTLLSDEGILILTRTCPGIYHLDISDTVITDDAFTLLANLKELKILKVNGIELTGSGVKKILESCQRLRFLELDSFGLSEQSMFEIKKWQSYNGLSIDIDKNHPNKLTVYDPNMVSMEP